MVHDNCALLVVDLGINASVADQVDDPLLTLILVKAETSGEILDVDALVDFAVRLGDEVTGSLDEGVRCRNKEEVGTEHLLSLDQLLLGLLEVEIDVKSLNEVGNWVAVLVVLLLDDTDDVLELLLVLPSVACAGAVGDDCSGQVSEDPWAGRLDGVDEWRREEQVADGVARWLVIEEWEKCPVNQPSTVSELCEWVGVELRVDLLLNLLDLLHSGLPVGGEDIRSELSPGGSGDLLVVGGENTELVKQLRGGSVVTAAILEVSEIVKSVNHLWGDLDLH